MHQVCITGTGSCLPDRVLTNAELERMVDTSDEWITQRTGIRERRIVADGQACSDLAAAAGRRALEAAGVAAQDLDCIIVGTVTPDTYCPAAAVYVQEQLGATGSAAFDLSAACTGFVYAGAVAQGFITSGMMRRVLVIGAEALSRVIDYKDRNSCILFGDGAGAAVFEAAGPAHGDSRVIDSYLRADGSAKDLIDLPAGGSRLPATSETVAQRLHFLRIKGKEVFKFATKAMIELTERALEKNGFKASDIDLLVPHQVNYRIIEAAQKKIDIPTERIHLNLDRYGNTSAASVPIALDEAVRAGRIKKGSLVLMVAFGAGMTWGYLLVRW